MTKTIFKRIPDSNFLKTEKQKENYYITYTGRYENQQTGELVDIMFDKTCLETEDFYLGTAVGVPATYPESSSEIVAHLYLLCPIYACSKKPWLQPTLLTPEQARIFLTNATDSILEGNFVRYCEHALKTLNTLSVNELPGNKDRDYYGKNEFLTYGTVIIENLSGQKISKRKDLGDKPGGLICESEKLGINMWSFLSALEGLCANGFAKEIDDSTYLIY